MSNVLWFTVMYVKNVILLLTFACIVLTFFDTPRNELESMSLSYEALSDSMKVLIVTGLAAVPLIPTQLESKFLDWLFKKGNHVF